jgi:thiosulfate/3-mercaptopyruvate sulfurtransferase
VWNNGIMTDDSRGYANPELLISAEELAARLGLTGKRIEDIVLIDLRPTEQFAASHIPGAVHLDLFGVSLVNTDPTPLEAFLWMIAHLLTSRGVVADRSVVTYDEHSGIRAARAFWFLEFFGHSAASVLDGGFGAWQRIGLPTTREAVAPCQGQWEVNRHAQRLATWRQVESRLEDVDTVLLDTRSDCEYRGTKVRARRAGAIPGAVHIEWTQNLSDDGRFKTAAELRAMYEHAGVTSDKEIISYCQGGYRAAHSYLALRLLGYPRVRNYIGSWKEWGDRDDLPVEVPI